MKLTIFSRLVIGYLVIFVLVIAMNLYTIVRLGQLNDGTRSVLMTHHRMMENLGKLTDTLLSQIGNEKKFLITKDEAFYTQFSRLKRDWDRSFGEVMFLAAGAEVRGSLGEIKASYERYQSLLQEEATYVRRGLSYTAQQFKEAKEEATNLILEQLDKARTDSQQTMVQRLEDLYEAGAGARRMAIWMTGAFILVGLVVSFFMNRSITRPIDLLKKKTREIAKGNLQGDVNLSSPPEIGELASAFNLMCRKLQELDKMKSDFFSSVSHELRTPLATVKMGIGLLEDGTEGPVNENQGKLLTILDAEINRLIELVNTLLDLSKMEAGMMAYHFEKDDLGPLISRAVREMGPLAGSKRLRLETEIVERLPTLKMDTERILQALRNLIGNAVKFTPEGGEIRLSARSVNGGVEVSVTDTGPGIPAEHLATIFEKFRQVASKGASPIRGTGLGLAITKQIILQHGGKIWAESEPGHGSTFTFVLPA